MTTLGDRADGVARSSTGAGAGGNGPQPDAPSFQQTLDRMRTLQAPSAADGGHNAATSSTGPGPGAKGPQPDQAAHGPRVEQPSPNPFTLFGLHGISYEDIYQNGIGDCYFLASLGVTAKNDPNFIFG
jgi:hypothetical protein